MSQSDKDQQWLEPTEECTDPKIGILAPRYVLSELDSFDYMGESRQPFEKHLQDCASCKLNLANYRIIITYLRDNPHSLDDLGPHGGV